MKRSLKIGIAIFGSLAFSQAVVAGEYSSGVVDKAPEEVYTEVEFGSGWYLRGDISYNISGENESGTQFIAALGNTFEYEYNDAIGIRGGFGYQFNPNFRTDITIEQMFDSEFSGNFGVLLNGFNDPGGGPVAVNNIAGTETVDASYSASNLMVSAYFDLPLMGAFTPYVGAGVGVSRVNYAERRTLTCNPGPTESCVQPAAGPAGTQVTGVVLDADDTYYSISYQLAVGTAYALSENLDLDVGYTYFSSSDGAELNYADGTAIDRDGFSIHRVNVGLRYEIW